LCFHQTFGLLRVEYVQSKSIDQIVIDGYIYANAAIMKSDLEEAIESYEIEKVELEKQVADYVKEADYLYAHYHQRALRKINQTLNILKELQNPMYRRIDEQKMQIDNCKRMLALQKLKIPFIFS
jgi:hypothetical protein